MDHDVFGQTGLCPVDESISRDARCCHNYLPDPDRRNGTVLSEECMDRFDATHGTPATIAACGLTVAPFRSLRAQYISP